MTNSSLIKLQSKALNIIFCHLAPNFPDCEIIFGGGTALARLYLHHRVSYDLDFFLSKTFDPVLLSRRLADHGMPMEITGLEAGSAFASQLHGTILISKQDRIKVSFVEDVFWGMFDAVEIDDVQTEVIDGLYHRKLRTISGTGVMLSQAGHQLGIGHRQTARDLFDLYALDASQEPVEQFITRINKNGAGFPTDIFRQNLAAIQWMELIDECEMLEVLAPYKKLAALELKRHFDDILSRLLQCDAKAEPTSKP